MKLTILGGSAAGPNPGQGCSGYLVQSGSTCVVLDLGPGTLPELRLHTDFRQLDAVVISHTHLDHMLDVLALRYSLAYNPIPPQRPVPLWLPPEGRSFLQGLAKAIAGEEGGDQFFDVFELHEYDPADELEISGLSVRFHCTHHFVPCWAIRVSNGVDGDLCYTADTGPTAALHQFAHHATLLVAEGTECAHSDIAAQNRGHLTPEEAGQLARNASAQVLVLAHLWAERNQFQALAQAEAAFGGPVMLATPGLVLRWNARSIETAGRR
jgi:ribonuclease BN (tRNA processing enzyme)